MIRIVRTIQFSKNGELGKERCVISSGVRQNWVQVLALPRLAVGLGLAPSPL